MFIGTEHYCYICGKYSLLEVEKKECIYCNSMDVRTTTVRYKYLDTDMDKIKGE